LGNDNQNHFVTQTQFSGERRRFGRQASDSGKSEREDGGRQKRWANAACSFRWREPAKSPLRTRLRSQPNGPGLAPGQLAGFKLFQNAVGDGFVNVHDFLSVGVVGLVGFQSGKPSSDNYKRFEDVVFVRQNIKILAFVFPEVVNNGSDIFNEMGWACKHDASLLLTRPAEATRFSGQQVNNLPAARRW
jgi:hypothetical protein